MITLACLLVMVGWSWVGWSWVGWSWVGWSWVGWSWVDWPWVNGIAAVLSGQTDFMADETPTSPRSERTPNSCGKAIGPRQRPGQCIIKPRHGKPGNPGARIAPICQRAGLGPRPQTQLPQGHADRRRPAPVAANGSEPGFSSVKVR